MIAIAGLFYAAGNKRGEGQGAIEQKPILGFGRLSFRDVRIHPQFRNDPPKFKLEAKDRSMQC